MLTLAVYKYQVLHPNMAQFPSRFSMPNNFSVATQPISQQFVKDSLYMTTAA